MREWKHVLLEEDERFDDATDFYGSRQWNREVEEEDWRESWEAAFMEGWDEAA